MIAFKRCAFQVNVAIEFLLIKKDWGDYLVFQQILRNFAIVMKNPLRPP